MLNNYFVSISRSIPVQYLLCIKYNCENKTTTLKIPGQFFRRFKYTVNCARYNESLYIIWKGRKCMDNNDFTPLKMKSLNAYNCTCTYTWMNMFLYFTKNIFKLFSNEMFGYLITSWPT